MSCENAIQTNSDDMRRIEEDGGEHQRDSCLFLHLFTSSRLVAPLPAPESCPFNRDSPPAPRALHRRPSCRTTMVPAPISSDPYRGPFPPPLLSRPLSTNNSP